MNFFKNKYIGYLIWRFILKNPRFRIVLQKILYPRRTCFVDILGESVFIDTQKELGYYRASRIIGSNIVLSQETPMMLALMTQIRSDTTFIDCGANVGFWSAQIGRMGQAVPNLRVMSFEANPNTFSRLERTCAKFPNIRCFNVALSDSVRMLDMVEGAGSGVFGVCGGEFQIPEKIQKIKASPLDDFIGEEITDVVMKVDVEGHELEVVKGVEKAMGRGAVRAILLDGILDRNRTELLSLLSKHEFLLYDCDSLRPYADDGDRILAIRGDRRP